MNPDTRKPDPRAVLRSLPQARQEQIFADLKVKSARDVQASLKQDGIQIGTTALYNFFDWCTSEEFFSRAEEARQQLQLRIFEATPGLTMAAATQIADAAFLNTTAALGNLDDYIKVRKIVLAESKQQTEARKLAILEAKAAQADAANAALKDATLTPEARAAKLREVFGIS